MKEKVLLGFSKKDITPNKSVEMVGFYREDNKSKGILHPLYIEVALWQSTQELCCFITIDSIGYMLEDSNKIRDMVANHLQISQDKVMLCFSHTHSAVNISDEPEYFDDVCKQILAGVKEAQNNLSPIHAATKNIEADIGFNRRDKDGELDKRIGIIKIVDEVTNKLKLIILRVTAHANILYADNYLISSDYIGVTRHYLEEKYDCGIMITQGASGNVEAKYHQSCIESLEAMANEISKTISDSIETMPVKPISYLQMYSKKADFVADVPTVKRATDIAEEALLVNYIDGTNWLDEVKRVNDLGIKQQSLTIEVQYFYINDYCFCGIANEVMCEIALAIAKIKPNLYFAGYTNGCTGYLPTADEYDRGGYEVLHSCLIYYIYHKILMPLNRDTADKLIEMVIRESKR